MGRGKLLTEAERAQVDTLNNANCSIREIAKRLKPDDCAIRNYLRNEENYGEKRKGWAARATTERERKKIIRIASHSTAAARQIRDAAGTSFEHFETISIHSSVKAEKETARNREGRLNFASNTFNGVKIGRSSLPRMRSDLISMDLMDFNITGLRNERTVIPRHEDLKAAEVLWYGVQFPHKRHNPESNGHVRLYFATR
ncbi:hypothetical protein Trydic_g3379 [Trypoxylus dichotomus]